VKNLSVYLICLLVSFAGAQSRAKLDSLLKVKQQAPEDTVEARHYINTCYAYKKIDPDSAVYWVNKAIALSKKINSEKYIVLSYHSKGFHYKSIGESQTALDTILYAYSLSKGSEKKTNLVSICQDLGVLYRIVGNFDKSVLYFQEALKQAELTKNKKGMYNAYNSLANTYSQMGMSKKAVHDLERALQFYDKAYVYADSSNKSVISMIKGNSGVALFNMGILKSDSTFLLRAKDCYMEALSYKVQLNDSLGMSQCYGNIAGAYHELCNIKPLQTYLNIAKKYYELAIAIGRKMESNTMYHDVLNYGTHLGLMGRLKKDKSLVKLAVENLKKALVDAEKFGDVLNVMVIHGSLASCYQDLGMHEISNSHLNRFVSLKDTILSQENKQIAEELAAKYESDLKDTENNSLKNEAVLREEVISKKSTTINLMIIGSVLLLGLIILVFISRQKINKARQLTEKQKLIIEEKNKEITDSINYAKRLQNAILTTDKTMRSVFSDSFVFYKPKDIVSGDFYWMFHVDDKKANKDLFILTAADCTGHGVPGAFMSMLNSTLLNQTAYNPAIITPADALNFLNRELPKNLRSNNESENINDGMDIAFCMIDLAKNSMKYAGANNPCWIIRDNALIELKPLKQAITAATGYEKKEFIDQEIVLQKNDRIYLFTDGYADQFGGPNGKKFKYKTLGDLLLSIHQKPADEQKNILEQRFNEWRGDLEQVDDVLVVGLTI
jgi:serine phosphatase RsbU (regulator of sigma subunit)